MAHSDAMEGEHSVQRLADDGHAGVDDDLSLIRRAQAGDATAFERLVTQYYSFIYRTAYRWLGHKDDAEDITQTICMRLATTLTSFDGRASFTSWLYRVTLNAVRDLQRSHSRVKRQASAVAAVTSEAVAGDQEDAMRVEDIWRRVRQLPDKQRDAVLLVYGEEMSHADAAAIMQCREVTVSWHIHKARKALKDLL